MNNLKKQILENLDPSYKGVLWFSNELLKDYPKPFPIMNYLVDGQITDLLNSEELLGHEKSFLFCGDIFRKNFYVSYINSSQHDREDAINNSVKIITKNNEKSEKDFSNSRILVLCEDNLEDKEKIFLQLKTNFPKLLLKKIII